MKSSSLGIHISLFRLSINNPGEGWQFLECLSAWILPTEFHFSHPCCILQRYQPLCPEENHNLNYEIYISWNIVVIWINMQYRIRSAKNPIS